MAEVEFDVDLKVGFRLDLNNPNWRRAFLEERIALENAQKYLKIQGIFWKSKPFCHQGTKNGGKGDGDKDSGDGRVSEKWDWDQTVEDFEGWDVSLHSRNNEEALTCFVSFRKKVGWGGPSVR